MAVMQLPSACDTLIVVAEFPICSLERLFSYWVEPDLLQQWWPSVAEVKPRLEGGYRFLWPQMNWCLYGKYTAFEPGKKLAFTWQWEHYATPEEVIVTFEALPAQGTKMTIVHGPYSDSEQGQKDRESHLEGWMYFVSKLQTLVS